MKKCEDCGREMQEMEVKVEGAEAEAKGWKCECGNIAFDEESGMKVVEELERKEVLTDLPTLSLEQKIIKLSKGRLGMYLPKDVVRCAEIQPGKKVFVSLLDKKKILLTVE